MAVKINVKKELGIAKTFDVRESNKNVRASWLLLKKINHMQMMQSKAQEGAIEEFDGIVDEILSVQADVISYIIATLKLTDVQAEKIDDDLGYNETVELGTRIVSEILHLEPTEATDENMGLKS